MDAKEQSDFDQAGAFLGDSLPAYWWRLYESCREKGFSESDAMKLLTTYILSQGQARVNMG